MRTVYVVKELDADTSNVSVTCVYTSKKEARKAIREENRKNYCFYCGVDKCLRYGDCEENRMGHVPAYEYWYQPVPMLP